MSAREGGSTGIRVSIHVLAHADGEIERKTIHRDWRRQPEIVNLSTAGRSKSEVIFRRLRSLGRTSAKITRVHRPHPPWIFNGGEKLPLRVRDLLAYMGQIEKTTRLLGRSTLSGVIRDGLREPD
jgi:hypothetical protein